jgi:hypothetical protein
MRIFTLLNMFLILGCMTPKIVAKKYSISYSLATPEYLRSEFISYKNCLIQFNLKTFFSQDFDANIKDAAIRPENAHFYNRDTITVFLRFKQQASFFEFSNFSDTATLLRKENSLQNYTGMKYSNEQTQAGNFRPDMQSARDTFFFGMPLKKVQVIEDTMGMKLVSQLYYLDNKRLNTVFNIQNQIKNIDDRYCLVGYIASDTAGRQLGGAFVSAMKDLTKEELRICESLYQKALQAK